MSSLTTLILQIIPLALGAAVSPTALMGMILLLTISKRPKLQGFGYYIGALILIFIVILLGILLGVGVTSVTPKPYPILAGIDVLFGIFLLLFCFRRIFKNQNSQKFFQRDKKQSSKSLQFLEGLSYGFGMFLINFSTTILVLEAGKEIGASSVDLIGKLIVISILTIITLIVCEVPLVTYILFPEKADKVLSKVNKWMQRNGHYLMGAVIVVIGIYLIWIGLLRLGIIF